MKTILLLVEDDYLKARMITRFIQREGIEFLRVTTTEDAVRSIREGAELHGEMCKIGAVLTDWMFPLRDGDHIRDHAGQPVYDEAIKAKLPVAVFSGRDEPVEGIKAWIKSTEPVKLTLWLRKIKRERAA